jgi:glycosyltransferase involved in cell wall biosynthesis
MLNRELRNGFDTTLAAGIPTAAEGELTDPAVEVKRVPLVRRPDPLTDWRAFRAIRALVRETDPALIHTHTAKAGAIGRAVARRSRPRPRTVHTFHGHVLEGYFSRPVQRGFVEIERRLASWTDALVTVSEDIRDQLLNLGIGRAEQYRVIPLGFDLRSLLEVEDGRGELRARLGLGQEVPLVGIVGRLVPIKDHLTAFRALAELPTAHLAVLGDGELRAELESSARAMGLAERVHFTGWWMDVPGAMSDLDVIVLTSRNEGTPVTLIEALAAARPVVATDVGGVRSVVADGVSGRLVPPGNPIAVADALRQLLSAPAERRRLGEAGRADVRARYGQERLVAEITALYRELLG